MAHHPGPFSLTVAACRRIILAWGILMAVGLGAAHASCPEGMEPITEMVPSNVAGPSPGGWVPVTRCIPSAAPTYSAPTTGAPLTNQRGVNNTGVISLWNSATGTQGYSFARWGDPNMERSQKDAVETCKKDGGINCAVSLACWNCHITVSRDATGLLRATSADTRKKAEREMKKMCRADKAKCTVLETRDFSAFVVNTAY